MVVIPARDEEENIGRAVRSLPHDTVIVVDDHSTDRTAEVAREAGAGVLTAPDLIRGTAIGKANACAFGAETLVSRWVLFTDADTWFEPGFLDAAVACGEASGLSLISIYLDPEYRGIAEQALVPYAQALAFAGCSMSADYRVLFRGQCLLALREPYRFAGGHGAVITQLSDDLKLTQLAERHRLKFAISRAPGLGHIRLYQGYSGVIGAASERQAFRFMLVNPAIGIVILLDRGIGRVVAALAGLADPGPSVDRGVRFCGRADIDPVAVVSARFVLAIVGKIAGYAPVALYGILPALAAGFFDVLFGRPVRWKGRMFRAVS